MSKMIILCLGLTILAFILPNQVVSENSTVTVTPVVTSGNTTQINATSLSVNATAISSTTHSHANSVYAASTLLLGFASVSLLSLYC
ncbi:hypothetical protein XELAEV_18027216mg [Xenopus laevis]|uniref:Uncharacterized protein n=1 Tax=Xenopus laevis TaxID=8355 RepID=A0A974CX29_XENLA|nr:hypothetical protein XELAEV_18027216mg [Xenopus laevis]